jgi:hypothetical protein
MPNLNEFIGPQPTESQNENLEKIYGDKPCFKCDLNVDEYFWDPTTYTMSWKCPDGHSNSVKVNG